MITSGVETSILPIAQVVSDGDIYTAASDAEIGRFTQIESGVHPRKLRNVGIATQNAIILVRKIHAGKLRARLGTNPGEE